MYNYSGTPCRTPCKSYVTTTFKWCYIQVHIFDIEALFKACYMYASYIQGSKLKKMSGRKFATSYENLVATLKMLVAKLIEAI